MNKSEFIRLGNLRVRLAKIVAYGITDNRIGIQLEHSSVDPSEWDLTNVFEDSQLAREALADLDRALGA